MNIVYVNWKVDSKKCNYVLITLLTGSLPMVDHIDLMAMKL